MRKSIRRGAFASAALGLAAAGTLAMAPLASASTTAAYIRDGMSGTNVYCRSGH